MTAPVYVEGKPTIGDAMQGQLVTIDFDGHAIALSHHDFMHMLTAMRAHIPALFGEPQEAKVVELRGGTKRAGS